MNDVFSGILAGIGQAHQESQRALLTQEMARRQNLAEFWHAQASDPNVRPEARDVATQNFMGIIQTPYDKKLSKEHESLSGFLSVSPRMGGTIQPSMPQPEEPPPQAQHQPLPQLAIAPPPVAPPFISNETLRQPQFALPARYTDEELMDRAQRTGRMQAQIAGEKAGAEKAAELKATYTPENVAAMTAIEEAKKGPLIVPRGGSVFDRKTNRMIAVGQPPERSAELQQQDAAVRGVADRYGIQLDPSKGELLGQLPTASMRSEALRDLTLMKENPNINAARQLDMQAQRLRMQETSLRIKQLLAEENPRSMDAIVSLIDENPRVLEEFTGKEKGRIVAEMRARGVPVPAKIGEALETQESQAQMTMSHVQAVRDIIDKNPELVGPVMGRLLNLEGRFGDPVFSASNDPEKARIEQRLRTSMTYLTARELQGLIKGRPAIQWLEEIKKVSPNVAMSIDFLRGSLEGVESGAQIAINEANRKRYGSQTRRTPAPAPPPGAGAAAGAGAGTGGLPTAGGGEWVLDPKTWQWVKAPPKK